MQRKHRVLPCLVVAALTLLGCSKSSSGTGEGASSAGVANADIARALKAVPGEAALVASISSPTSFWNLASGREFVPMDAAIGKELDSELKKHIDEHLGLDFRELRSAVVFATGSDMSAAVILTPVRGSLRMGQDVEGGKLLELSPEEDIVAVHKGDTMIVGQRPAALAGLAALAGSNEGLTGTFKELVVAQVKDAPMSVSAEVSMLPIPPNPVTGGLQFASARYAKGKVSFKLKGENAALTSLSEQLDAVMTLAVLGLKTEVENSKSDLLQGIFAIVGYYSAQNMAKLLKPTVKGDTLSLDMPISFGGSGGAAIVPIVGILAAVAIPAFMKYIKKSKSSEASVMLRRLQVSAQIAQMEGTLPEHNIGPTPPLGTCCAADSDTCQPVAAYWSDPAWQALGFSIDDSHHYSYEFRREGEGFEVRAYGDLDCDGMYSIFSMGSGEDAELKITDELE